MTQVKAAVCRAFGGPLQVETVTLAAPGAGEVEVKIAACAICHSDISMAEGGWGGALPAVYGHEAAGHVTALGEGVTGYALGDTVLVTLVRACGSCLSCTTGHPATCRADHEVLAHPLSGADGTPFEQGLRTGAFAEKVVVKASQLAPIPADMPLDAASILSCGVITGVGAVVNTAGLRAGQSAVVIGAGGVGLNAVQGARIAGAAHVVAVDLVAEKLEAARAFGATDAVSAGEKRPWDRVREIIGGGADHVFVATGAIAAFEGATRYLAPHGRVTIVGLPHAGERSTYDPCAVGVTGQQIAGSKMGDVVLARDIPWMVTLYRQGRLKLDELISNRWPLERINEAIADTKSGAARRNVIVFD
jgi:Zn-dependent alcohol dehydrogenase